MADAKVFEPDDRVKKQEIFDLDFHLHMPVEHLYDYIDDSMILDKLENYGDPPNVTSGWSFLYSSESGSKDMPKHMKSKGAVSTADGIVDVMDQMGLSKVLVDPGTNLPLGIGGERYPPIKLALVRAYNDYVLDNIIDVDRGVYASVVLPRWNPQACVEELDRVGDERGIIAAYSFWSFDSYLWGSIQYDPVFEKLTSLDLPLALHIGPTENRYDTYSDSMRTYVEVMCASRPHAMILNVINMIMTGVFDKFPDLEIIIQEGGVNWIPYLAHRSDEVYVTSSEDVWLSERMREMDERYLDKMPSEYLFENIFVTTQPISLPDRSDDVKAALKLCHASEMFMFSTDWPHTNSDVPNWLFEQTAVDEELRERIFHKNAEKVLRLPNQ